MMWALGLWTKSKGYALIVAGAAVAVFVAWRQVREDGKNEFRKDIAAKRDAQQAEWDRIDADRPDPNASIERMRKLDARRK